MEKGADGILVLWHYQVGELQSNNDYESKLMTIPSIMQGVPIASLMTVSIECLSNCCPKEELILSDDLIATFLNSIKTSYRFKRTL
mgnify:CR=1 FL=1